MGGRITRGLAQGLPHSRHPTPHTLHPAPAPASASAPALASPASAPAPTHAPRPDTKGSLRRRVGCVSCPSVGFNDGSWPLFRLPDGTPRTPRGADGLPAAVTTTCFDGGTRSNILAVSAHTLEVPSRGSHRPCTPTAGCAACTLTALHCGCTDGAALCVLQVASERGTTVTRIVTPRVRALARDIFGCSTLRGAELENQPTANPLPASTCYGSRILRSGSHLRSDASLFSERRWSAGAELLVRSSLR
jgi:hypothetical protein